MDIQMSMDHETKQITMAVLTPGHEHRFTGTGAEVRQRIDEVLVPFVRKCGDPGQAQDFRAEMQRMLVALEESSGEVA